MKPLTLNDLTKAELIALITQHDPRLPSQRTLARIIYRREANRAMAQMDEWLKVMQTTTEAANKARDAGNNKGTNKAMLQYIDAANQWGKATAALSAAEKKFSQYREVIIERE